MENLLPTIPRESELPNPVATVDVSTQDVLAQKRQIRALKRILIAKAEVRRLKSLLGRRRVTAGL